MWHEVRALQLLVVVYVRSKRFMDSHCALFVTFYAQFMVVIIVDGREKMSKSMFEVGWCWCAHAWCPRIHFSHAAPLRARIVVL